MNIGIYAPDLDTDTPSAPQFCLQQTIPHLRENATVTLITHERKDHDLYRDQVTVSPTPIKLERDMNRKDFDVVHFTGFYHRHIPGLVDPPTVLAYHGDVQWAEPELNYGDTPIRTSRKQRAVEVAKIWQYDHVVFVSRDLQKRTESRYSRFLPDSTVVYNGLDHDTYTPTDCSAVIEKYGIERPYILHVSNFSQKKNPIRLLEAFGEVVDYCEVNLVVAGGGWTDEDSIQRLLDELDIADRTAILGYVPEEDLPALYSGAEAFVFPSLHETFGIPVIESMACGTAVVTSSAYALPEVGGWAAIYCAETLVQSIANSVEYVLKCGEARRRYESSGLERASRFSWERRAEELMKVYDSIRN